MKFRCCNKVNMREFTILLIESIWRSWKFPILSISSSFLVKSLMVDCEGFHIPYQYPVYLAMTPVWSCLTSISSNFSSFSICKAFLNWPGGLYAGITIMSIKTEMRSEKSGLTVVAYLLMVISEVVWKKSPVGSYLEHLVSFKSYNG